MAITSIRQVDIPIHGNFAANAAMMTDAAGLLKDHETLCLMCSNSRTTQVVAFNFSDAGHRTCTGQMCRSGLFCAVIMQARFGRERALVGALACLPLLRND